MTTATPTQNTLITKDQNGSRQTYKAGSTQRIEPGALVDVADAGTTIGDGSDTVENRLGVIQTVRFNVVDEVVTTTDNTTNGANGSVALGTLPRGNLYILGAVCSLTLVGDGTGLAANAAVVGAIGSVAAAADATLSSTEADIIPSTACTLSSSAGTFKGRSTTPKMFDNTTIANATQLAPKLNFAVPDAGTSANGSLTVNGYVDITYINFGDC